MVVLSDICLKDATIITWSWNGQDLWLEVSWPAKLTTSGTTPWRNLTVLNTHYFKSCLLS